VTSCFATPTADSEDAGGVTCTFAGAAADDPDPSADPPSDTVRPTDVSGVASGVTSSVTLPAQSGVGSGRKSRKLTYWQGVARIGVQIADALEYAHRQGIIHRDVKPSNLLLDLAGTVWVTDFGLAKADGGDNLTHTGDVLGTLRYVPPEAFDGQSDARSDVDSLRLTLYEMAALRPAFDEKDRNKLIKQVTTTVPTPLRKVRRALPRDLETIVAKAIDREPGRRYQTAAELRDDLQRFLDDEPITARRQTAAGAAWRWARHHKAMAALVATIGLVLAAVAVASSVLAAHFRTAEHYQKGLAERNQKLADANDAARKEVEKALGQSQRDRADLDLTLADTYTLQGLQAGPTGRHRDAPLWFAKAAETSSADPHRHWANRIRALAWSDEVSRPVAAYRYPGNYPGSLAFHPSNRYLLADGNQTRPVILDIKTGRTLTIPAAGTVTVAAWSPDGTELAASADGAVLVYRFPDLTNPEQLSIDGATILRYSPDGKLLAYAGQTAVGVWDRARGVAAVGPWPLQNLLSLQFTDDSTRLVTADAAGVFHVFRVSRDAKEPALTGAHLQTGGGWSFPAPLVVGNRLITVSTPNKVTCRIIDSATEDWSITLPFTGVMALAVSSDGQLAVAATGHYSMAVVFRVATGQRVVALNCGALRAAFHPNRQSLVLGSGNPIAEHRSVPSGKHLPTLAAEATGYRALAFSADGRYLATVWYESQVRVWALPQPDPAEFVVPEGQKRAGDGVFTADSRSVLIAVPGDAAQFYDVSARRAKGPPLRPEGTLVAADVTPDGRTVVLIARTPEGTGRIEFRDPVTGDARFPASSLPEAPGGLAVSPTGKRAAVICENGLLRLFDPSTGQTVPDVTCEKGSSLWRVKFSSDGETLLVPGSLTFQVRAAVDGRERFPQFTSPDFQNTANSHDSRLIATGGRNKVLRIWDGKTGRQVGGDLPHPSWIDGDIVFHPGGGYVCTGGKDGLIRVWDLNTGKQLSAVPSLGGLAAFTPDGNALVTASYVGLVEVWDWRSGTRLLPSRQLALTEDAYWTGLRQIRISPDGRLAAVSGRPAVHVLSLAALSPPGDWSDRDLTEWGELIAHQRFHQNGLTNLTGDEWLARWRAFRGRHPDSLPGEPPPARRQTSQPR
jgi:WD40 repeat protein